MIRSTTNGVLKGYRYNLYTSRYHMDKATNTVLTRRNFNSYAEDPAAAAHCYQLRRSYQRSQSQLSLGESVCRKYDVAWKTMESVMGDVNQRVDDSAMAETIRGMNDGTAAGRSALGESLNHLADSIVQSMNARYGDNFVFAGADGLKVPFSWDENHEKLLYRGVPVDTPAPPELKLDAAGAPQKFDQNGDPWAAGDVYYKDNNGNVISQKDYDQNKKDFDALSYMSTGEKKYADLGLGLQEDENGEIIQGSAINVALQGIDFLDWGMDADGDPKNVVSIIRKMGSILGNCDPDSGDYANGDEDLKTMERLMGKLELASSKMSQKHVALDTQKKFLDSNQEQLDNHAFTLTQQFTAIEDVDLAEAISDLSWAKLCYNTALKVGNSVLSQSLMDYINA